MNAQEEQQRESLFALNDASIGGAIAAYEKYADQSSSVRTQLERKKATLTKQLAETQEALQALNDNPEIERVLTLVGRTVRF